MPTTAPRTSPGADALRAASLLLLLAAPRAAFAQDYSDGLAAYAARDWAAAETLWLAEAEAGSADALLGLGNLYDFGLLGAPDFALAFDYYLRSADLGMPEAAFNVAVMHDAGVGVDRDVAAAAAWYAFAALDGNARGAYNLGQAFAGGAGVPANPGLAAYWLRQAEASIPSAAAALDALPSEAPDAGPAAPDPLALELYTPPSGPAARMAWAGTASPADARYRVDLVRLADLAAPVASAETTGSAISVPLAAGADPVAWRVTQIAGDAYAASDWQGSDGVVLAAQPIGTVRFAYAAQDRRAEGLAYRLGGAMARFGVVVDYSPVDGADAESGVTYGYVQDADLAGDVSAFLPGVGPDGAVLRAEDDVAPGEVRVVLSFAGADR